MALGQAAGAAAGIAVKDEEPVSAVDTRKVQKELLRQNVYLGSEERLHELKIK